MVSRENTGRNVHQESVDLIPIGFGELRRVVNLLRVVQRRWKGGRYIHVITRYEGSVPKVASLTIDFATFAELDGNRSDW